METYKAASPHRSSTATATDPAANQFRVAAVDMFPAGDDMVLVRLRSHQDARFLREGIVDLLMQCKEFQTLDEHVRAYGDGQQGNSAAAASLRRELQKLAHRGYLVSKDDLLRALGRSAEQTLPPIASVGFPTSERIETLRRGLSSFVESCQRSGRTNDFLVVDDSTNANTRLAYRKMLGELQAQYKIDVKYAGLEEKLTFAQLLAKEGKIPEDVVRYACIGDKLSGHTTVGANRNVLLLHTVGDMFLSADDDIVCRLSVSPSYEKGVAFGLAGHPIETWFFPHRGAALGALDVVNEDVLALHEQWLGEPPCLSQSIIDERQVSLELVDSELLHRLEAKKGKVLLTLTGAVGDSGWDNPHFHLFQRGKTLQRITSSQQEYETARSSREIAHAASRVTITDKASPMLAMCIGLDNRDLLPPFPPIGRGEDVAFGAILSRCWNEVLAAHLPWILLHAPLEARSLALRGMFTIGPNSLLPACTNQFDLGLAQSPQERLCKLGHFLQDVGQLPEHAFDDFARLILWHSMSSSVTALEEMLYSGKENTPVFWADSAREYITSARRSALTPVDQFYANGGRVMLQQHLFRFGQVLVWWPKILEAARHLRTDKGIRLAMPV